jgi:hypothetical protein
MRKLLLVAVALGGFGVVTASGAVAAPFTAGVHATPTQGLVTHVDYYHNHQHYHHRHYEHGHWRYWN